jgi:NAD(P)-dependent dehydrogenase (short-subunit alcohol dehydrogenase family)
MGESGFLHGRVALVTGATGGGMGRSIAMSCVVKRRGS